MLCREWSIVHRAIDHAMAKPLECHCWHCMWCAPQRRKELIARILGGDPNTFITITIKRTPKGKVLDARALLSKSWNLLVRRIKRRYRLKAFPFFAVVEATKTGWPHLHVLARVRWIDQKFLSACMAELADSPICDIRRIDSSGRAKGYVTKYVGKAPHQFGSFKRYWFSRDYNTAWNADAAKPHGEKLPWFIERKRLSEIIEEFDPMLWEAEPVGWTMHFKRRCR